MIDNFSLTDLEDLLAAVESSNLLTKTDLEKVLKLAQLKTSPNTTPNPDLFKNFYFNVPKTSDFAVARLLKSYTRGAGKIPRVNLQK